jgi:predicted Kef-type K+ transport protein
MVGYLIAGLVIGPYTPGFVAYRAIANQLAEIGVILLMFGVGLHFGPKDLLAVRRIATQGPATRWLNPRTRVAKEDGPEPADPADHAVVVG